MRKIEITGEQLEEIRAAKAANTNKKVEKRLRALEMRGEGYSNKAIAEETELNPAYIGMLVSRYDSEGIESIVHVGYGRTNRNITLEEEAEFLAPFKARIEAGETIKVREIKAAYEDRVGHKTGGGQIYTVLRRHGWDRNHPPV